MMNFQERKREEKRHINKHTTLLIRSKAGSLITLHPVSTNAAESRSEEKEKEVEEMSELQACSRVLGQEPSGTSPS